MHHIHEFYQLRHRIFRVPVPEPRLSALVMESGFPEGIAVDDWLRGGTARVRALLEHGLTYHMGECQEMLALVPHRLAW